MWILCADGSALNTDYVVRFRQRYSEVLAETPEATVTIGKTTVENVLRMIISNQKIMEVHK